MYNNKNLKQFYILFLVALNLSCKERSYSQASEKKDLIVNCYITKPVQADSKFDSLREFEFNKESLDNFLSGILSSERPVIYDSAMDFVTSFERQRLILLNNQCYEKLDKPDSCDLIGLYFNSGYRTKTLTKSIIEFVQSYKKNIYNFDSVTIYEYRFNGVAEVEPHFMYIILKEQTKDEKRYGKDYKGFVICSDGLAWKDYSAKGFSIPLFIQMVRRAKEFYIPLYFDGNRFIPIGHFKSNNWQD